MKLYYKAGACSLSPHIVMAELGFVYESEQVDLATKKMASGDYLLVNPKGSVPALRMENGEILTEGATIVQYLCELRPEGNLLKDKYRALEWMNYIATELHKNALTPFFTLNGMMSSTEGKTEYRASLVKNLETKINYISSKMGTNQHLMGNEFSAPDAYLFTCLSWTGMLKVDLSKWPNIVSFMERMRQRPSVIRAMTEEGMH